MLLNTEPLTYDAVVTKLAVNAFELDRAYDADRAGFVLLNTEPVTYDAVATKLAVNALDALKARLVLVNIEPVTYEAVPENCEVLDPVQLLNEEVVNKLPVNFDTPSIK